MCMGAAGRAPTPSVVCLDRQSVQTPEMGGPERGYDGGKNIKGRTRPLGGDTLGLVLAVLSPRARLDAGVAPPLLLSHVHPSHVPRLVTIWAAQQSHHHARDAWMAAPRASWRIAGQARPAGPQGFTPLAKLWGMERTNAWHGRCRRPSKDEERDRESRTAMIEISPIHLLLNRLTHGGRPGFHDRTAAA